MDNLKIGQTSKWTNRKMDESENGQIEKIENNLHMATLKLKNTCDNAMKRKAIERSKVGSSSLR